MRIRSILSALVMALAFFTVVAVQPAHATLPTPNEPILLVQSSSSTDPYQNFIPELLTTEGLNGFETAQLSDLNAAFLTPVNFSVVILPHLTLTAAQVSLFQGYVSAGGTLIGFRPDSQLASVFGVATLGTTLSEAWLKIDTTTPYAPNGAGSVMRFHGTADLYSLNGASALATLYNSSTLPTTSPAASTYKFGSGTAILFSFDLTQSIVLMRQGNPAWAGYPNNHDGYNTMRASQMFMDQNTDKFWNDLGDGALSDIPQADIQMRLFSNALTLANTASLPMPRLWYYPNQKPSIVLFTGDDHSFPVADALKEVNFIASYGGLFSYNLWYPFTTVTNAQVTKWLTAGDNMVIHFNDTAEVDSSGVGGSAGTWNGMQSVMTTALNSFATTYPTTPVPATTRNHFIMWVSNDANGTADQVANARLFQNNGIQMDTSYSSFPNRWGYMTGSGLPMKFLDTKVGAANPVIPVYEQATQYEDDVQLGTTGYSLDWDIPTAQGHYVQTLTDSMTKYNAVTTFLFHPENWASYQSYAQAALEYAQTNSIPMSTASTWLTFWKARAATTFSKPVFASGTLTFTATGAPAGLTLMVPEAAGSNQVVSTFKVDGASQSFTVGNYQGVEQAGVILAAGTHAISVAYAPAGRILGQITPSAAAASTTIQIQGGSITETVPVAADGTYVVGPLPPGSYTVTPTSSLYIYSPAPPSVTVGTADVTGVNFTGTQVSNGQTLFTTQTPVVTNESDGSGVNYELGTAFTSTVGGQLIGVRFWKAPSESGTHTGRIWSSTGTLLGSVVFTNETASGWQQQALTAPIAIAANTNYIVSVNTAGTYYVNTASGLASQIVNGNLKSVVGNNGPYGSPGTFPTNSYQSSNYFRDVVFVAGSTYTVSGSITGTTGSGTTVTLTLGTTTIATATGVAGSYSFSGVPAGNYTVTPSNSGYTFSPTSAPANVTTSNVTVTTFTATAIPPTFTVSGSITGTTGSGTTVTLTSGTTTIATATGVAGSYSFNSVPAGTYTVTPTNAAYTFSPTNAAANVSTSNVTVTTFAGTVVTTTYTVSGSITGTTGSGTTVTLTSGTTTIATATGVAGSYSFNSVPAGNYTVTPTNAAYTFSPTSAAANVTTSNVTVTTFAATIVPPTYTVSGSITGTSGSGTTVTLTSGTTTIATATGVAGSYSFNGVPAGNYTVTPTNAAYTFSPTSAAANVTTSNVTVTTFAGTVVSGSQSLLTTQTPAVTNASDGASVNYELGMSFTSSAVGQITAVRFFKASSETGTHTGRIWSSSGTLLGSVVFANETASGWQQQALTTPVTIVANTTYIVSVNTGNTFYVATTGGLSTQVVNGSLSSVVGNNGLYGSTGTFPTNSYQGSNYFRDVVFVPGATYSITGSVPAVNSGATVTLTGPVNATTTANASGSYTFSGVPNGAYTVKPAMTGYTFNPTTASVTVSSANATVTAFTSTAVPTFTVSGSITPTSTASGTTVTLTLSGTTIATTTANVSGAYSFTGVAAGSYTVTPTKSGFTFNPASAPANVATSNVTVATMTVSGQTLLTTQTPDVTNASDGAGVNYELGTAVTSTVAGQITAVRFYKASSETGTHTGHIWSSTGTLLATVTFTGETASGWQVQTLTTPLAIAANTQYVVSVNTGSTFYVATDGGLSTQVVNGDLKSVVGNNGLYGTTGTFPTNTYQGSNYFRDVVFVPGS